MISSMERNIRFSNLSLEDYNTLKSHYQFKLLESLQSDSNFKAILEASNSNIKSKAELKREAEKLAKNGNEVIAKFGKAVLKFLATGTKALADLGLAISGILVVGGGVLATCITLIIGIILFAVLVVPFGALVSVLIKVDKSLGSYLHKTSPDKNVEKYKTLSKNIQKQKDGIKDINDLDKLIRVSEALDTVKDYPDMVPVGESAEILRLISVIEAKEQTASKRKKSDPTPKEIHDKKVAEREKIARKTAKEKENTKSPKEIHDEIEADRAKVKKEKLDADMAEITESNIAMEGLFGNEYTDIIKSLNAVVYSMPKKDRLLIDEIQRNKNIISTMIYYKDIKEDGKPVAFIHVSNITAFYKNYGSITIAVNPIYRKRGYAKQLIKQCISEMKSKKDVDELLMLIHTGNDNSVKLAKSCGFKLIRKVDVQSAYSYNLRSERTNKIGNFLDPKEAYLYISKNVKHIPNYDIKKKVSNSKIIFNSKKGSCYERAKVMLDVLKGMAIPSITAILTINDLNEHTLKYAYPLIITTYDYNFFDIYEFGEVPERGPIIRHVDIKVGGYSGILDALMAAYNNDQVIRIITTEKISVKLESLGFAFIADIDLPDNKSPYDFISPSITFESLTNINDPIKTNNSTVMLESICNKLNIFGDLAPEHLVVTEGLFNPSVNTPIMESAMDDTDVFMALENATSKPMLSGNSLLDSMIAITTEACNEESILKFLNRYKNTVVYEMTHEKYRDLPIIMETGLCLKYIRENCSDVDEIMESCDQLDQLLGEIVSESECELIEDASQFNPDPCGLGSLTPFPVADRAVGNALCDIESAETDKELTEALIQFGRISSMINESYYVDDDMMIMKEAVDGGDVIPDSSEESGNKLGKAARRVETGANKAVSKTATKDKSKGPVAAVKHTFDPMEKWVQNTYAKLKEKDANERREIILKGGNPVPKVLRWVKRSIPLIALGAAGTVVPAAAVISGITLIGFIASDKVLDKRERAKLLRELEDEIQVCNEKLEDSRGSDDKQARYQLLRIRNSLVRQSEKIRYNLKY